MIGGGNIIRGARMSQAGWIDRPTADSMGMLATVMNSLALETALNAAGVSARTMSAVSMPTICETYARQPALHYLDRGQVVLIAGGTGNPFFTTDTAAVLRSRRVALRRRAQGDAGRWCLLGRSEDPIRTATRYDRLTHDEAIAARPEGHGHGRLRARAREPSDRDRRLDPRSEFRRRDPRASATTVAPSTAISSPR